MKETGHDYVYGRVRVRAKSDLNVMVNFTVDVKGLGLYPARLSIKVRT